MSRVPPVLLLAGLLAACSLLAHGARAQGKSGPTPPLKPAPGPVLVLAPPQITLEGGMPAGSTGYCISSSPLKAKASMTVTNKGGTLATGQLVGAEPVPFTVPAGGSVTTLVSLGPLVCTKALRFQVTAKGPLGNLASKEFGPASVKYETLEVPLPG